MSNLNLWQRLDRVLYGLPFGDGSDGDYNSSTIPTMTYRSCSGTAGSTTLTLGSSAFSNGDVLLIHQTRGTGVGQWEVNRVVSGGGTTSLTLLKPLQYTYTDSGASQAQAVKILRYNNVTCPSGTWTVPSWNGDTGGIFVLAVRGTLTISGTISGGTSGFRASSRLSVGSYSTGTYYNAYQGEGSANIYSYTYVPNGNGGGGGTLYHFANGDEECSGGGGGGNYGTGGYSSADDPGKLYAGQGGYSVSSSDLITFTLGGAGGHGGMYSNQTGRVGGNGAGAVLLFAKIIPTITGAISLTGANGEDNVGDHQSAAGGGGAGGICLICSQTADIGTSKINCSGGNGGNGANYGGGHGGGGGGGVVRAYYSNTFSGTAVANAGTNGSSGGATTAPTSGVTSSTQDTTLRENVFFGGMV